MHITRKSIVLLTLVLLTSCATGWMKVADSDRRYNVEQYSVTLPSDWMRSEQRGGLMLSKDGPDLQRIAIQYRTHDKAFEKLERQSSATMLPSELAKLTIAELKASQEGGLPSLKVVRNEPVEIAGHSGFALHLVYKTDEGLRMEMLMRGFVDEKGLYLMVYRAPTLHYFERDRPVFESMAESFRL